MPSRIRLVKIVVGVGIVGLAYIVIVGLAYIVIARIALLILLGH